MPDERRAAAAPLPARIRAGVRRPANWLQLVRYAVVGGSGVVINLGSFTVFVHALDVDFRVAGVLAFCLAVTNNFLWHRGWTFRAREGRAGFQAAKFVTVSVSAFVVGLGMLWLLVETLDVAEVPAQAISLAVAAPTTFLVNRFWSFR